MKTITMRRSPLALALVVTMMASAGNAWAKLTPEEAARLGNDLTPVGAEKAGNADGSIPAWDGGLTEPPAGWTPAMGYVDPFPEDKPQVVISAANAEQYKDKLTPGTLALLKKYDNFRMPVYQTRRTAALPTAVTDTAKAQATQVELQGFGLSNLNGSNIPFPIPKNGQEAIWNHLVRYMGGGLDRTYHWFPVRSGGDSYKVGFREYRVYDQNMDRREDNRLFNILGYFLEPATLQGTVYLVKEPVDQVKEARSAWIYNSGARRVRRAPDLAYDNVSDGTESMRVTDQYDGYNGAPDRYEWKLVGKQELYVPYNAYKLSDKSLKYADILQKGTINADLMRYELHRVWVVEGTLKTGQKHIYGKRVMFLDEDSWTVLEEDAYDTRGQLWRVGVHPLIQFYDAGLPWYRANIWHDLSNGNYLVAGLDNEVKKPWKFDVKGRQAEFQPDALRRAGH
ncbi:DUF1329 domain-containing protein [Zestomonas carbonaria]|uniref:DUF1329 domain-containing protein n=1 Tax=Zestomonas carbonaria TaxID=2762745 RepID=A0A7U7EQU9_9GAMM|nr:DUF1329 domain-containing protein [Pseudomonas carbonaria]CAD5109380.1 hypothetical protein PSEWESI4_03677 [Pseudomonas carbonaria]